MQQIFSSCPQKEPTLMTPGLGLLDNKFKFQLFKPPNFYTVLLALLYWDRNIMVYA